MNSPSQAYPRVRATTNVSARKSCFAANRPIACIRSVHGHLGAVSWFRSRFPGRTAQLRQSSKQEIKATAVVYMDIEKASAKIRAKGVADDEEDYLLPIYAERLPVHTVLGEPEPCARLLPGVGRPKALAGYFANRRLEDAVLDAHAASYSHEGA